MTALWPHWVRPWWLLALPLMAWLVWQLSRQTPPGRWQRLLPQRFARVLLRRPHQGREQTPWPWLLLAGLLAIVALAGPSWQQLKVQVEHSSEPVVAMLDLSTDMLVTDLPPNRLARARHKLIDLFRLRAGAYTAVVVYAGSAHTLVPLTEDMGTLNNLISSVSPSIMPTRGRRADLAVGQAMQLLKQAGASSGHMVLITPQLDSREQQGIASALAGQPYRLDIIGMGTAEGGPIKDPDGVLERNHQGRIRLSSLNATELAHQAASLGGHYVNARLDDRDLRTLGLLPQQASSRSHDQQQLDIWREQGHWLLLPLLLVVALLVGRRGWLLGLAWLLLGLSAPQPGWAAPWPEHWQNWWLRPDQQGQRLLNNNHPAEAAKRFHDPRWQGMALYAAGDFGAAAEAFSQGNQASDHYNEGNALAKAGQLQAAIDAYNLALQLDPQLAAARHNKALVEQLLKQQDQQNGRGGQQSGGQQSASQNGAQSGQDQSLGQQGQSQQGQPGSNSAADEQSPQQQSADNDNGDGNTQPDGQQHGDANTSANQPKADQQQADAQPETADNDAGNPASDERQQALQQWLRQVPDDPAELMRRKFRHEQLQRQRQRQRQRQNRNWP